MTMWTEVNKDELGVAADQVALGPRVGPLENMDIAWRSANEASASHGIEEAMREREATQIKSMKDAGVENIPMLAPYAQGSFSNAAIGPVYGAKNYLTMAKYYEDGGDERIANLVNEYDKRIEDVRKRYPNLQLQTSREMWDTQKKDVQALEEKSANMRSTTMGAVAGFIAGAAGSLNPRTNPLNFMTTPAGGPGKTIVGRIAAQAGMQGGVQALNELTGVQEERRLLGLSNGFEDAFSRVAGTAVGAGVLQGIGEGLVAGGRRFFRNTPNDPAPDAGPLLQLEKPGIAVARDEARAAAMEANKPWEGQAAWEQDVKAFQEQNLRDLMNGNRPYVEELHPLSPMSNTRMGRARTELDLDYMSSRLEAWDGEAPPFVPPRTDTAIPRVVNDFTMSETKIDIHDPGKTLDDMARQVDPKLFGVYDGLAQRVTTYRQWLQDMHPQGVERRAKIQAQIDELDKKISNLSSNMSRVGSRRRADMAPKMEALVAEKQKLHQDAGSFDTPEMAKIREQLIREDNKMRDMGPMVARAYASAKKQWDLGAADREAVWQMIKDAKTKLPQAGASDIKDIPMAGMFEKSLAERAPILQQAPSVEASMRDGADAADYVTAIVKKNMDILDKSLEQYRTSIDALIKQDKGVVEINGQQYKLDLDKDRVVVPHEEGTGGREITVRQLLEENADTEADLKAIQVCGLK